MKKSPALILSLIFLVHCSRTEVGPKGDPGPAGAPGQCDASVCPKLNSVDGLSGGTINGKLTTTELSTESLQSQRTIIQKGAYQTSSNGFYCGKTDFTVNGAARKMVDPPGGQADILGPWAAKQYCQDICGHNAAHVCTTIEFIHARELRGGSGPITSSKGKNESVPMPPQDLDGGWVQATDGYSSCFGLATGISTAKGIIFIPDSDYGEFNQIACDQRRPIYCCL